MWKIVFHKCFYYFSSRGSINDMKSTSGKGFSGFKSIHLKEKKFVLTAFFSALEIKLHNQSAELP